MTSAARAKKGLLDQSLRGLLKKTLRCLGTVLPILGIGYCALLALYWLLAPTVGEANPTIALFLLLPPLIFGLPLALIFIPSVFLARKTALTVGVASLGHLLCFMDFEWSSSRAPINDPTPPSAPHLTVLSYNRGQHNNTSLQPFKNLTQPDVVVIQDAQHRAPNYQKAPTYSEFQHVRGLGEFVVLSKYPITSSEEIGLSDTPLDARTFPPAARFVIDFEGTPIALYAVHFPTPRDWLRSVKRGGFLYGILGIPGTPWAEKRMAYAKFWQEHRSAARALTAKASADPLPTLIAGDLNVADTGAIYRLVTQKFSDAHEAAGRGYGFTFPGETKNPAALLRPWLRLDYILSDSRWQTTQSVTERGRASQHRAVCATLRLLSPAPN